MDESREPIEVEARDRWRSLEGRARLELMGELESCLEELDPAVAGEMLRDLLLASDDRLRALHGAATPSARERVLEMARRAAGVLLEPSPDGSEHLPAVAEYARQLLVLALPLVSPADGSRGGASGSRRAGQAETDPTVELVLRAHRHPVLAPVARHRTLAYVARQALAATAPDIAEKAGELLSRGQSDRSSASWFPRPGHILLSVDHTAMRCARYLAGLERVGRDDYGFDELPTARAGVKRVDQVTVKYDPPAREAATSGLPGRSDAGLEGSELKAKLFVALLALGAQEARDGGGDGRIRVRLRDLLELMGYRLGRATNSAYYWRHNARLARYLLVDLPNRVVAMQARLPGSSRPLVVFERLLALALPLDERLEPLGGDRLETLRDALSRDDAELAALVRGSGLAGFEVAIAGDLLEALGARRPLNAVELVPAEVLTLRGTAFWLAWQVAFLRRWAPPPAGGGGGKPVLRILREAGYLERHTRGGRVRYKDALGAWWADVGRLVEMTLLEEPGVRLYALRGSAWRDVSGELSRALDPAGRVSPSTLQELRAVFSVPVDRSDRLRRSRRRSRRLQRAGTP